MRIRSVHYIAFIMLLVYCLIGCNSAVFDNLGGCPQGVYFQFYRQTPCEQFPGYPSDIREVRVFVFDDDDLLVANFLTRRQSFRQIILCPPHCGIRGNSRLSHGVAVTWRPMIFQIFRKALLPDRKCRCHCG